MSRRSSLGVAAIALVLGLGTLIGGLASAQEEPKPYLSCRFQEQTNPFTLVRFQTQEEAVRGILGREVDLGDGPLAITVLQ